MDDNSMNNEYRFGQLPDRARLAMAYVPMQQSSPPSYDKDEALARGTLFPGLDLPFMNMVNKTPAATGPLGEVMALDFVAHELTLYLDTHKDDMEAFEMLQSILQLSQEAHRRYTELYGPISRQNMLEAKSFTWLKSPWPWEYTERSDG